ncbi:MAG: hypothetical protein FKGGLIKP_00811 [Sodalis sp. Fse]|nr:MAG: hypothetical protein FKGGLIKP_00811 [Sodalis sp. Fse]
MFEIIGNNREQEIKQCHKSVSMQIDGGSLLATSHHTRRLLRLLPPRPDRIHKVALREHQQYLHIKYFTIRF